MSEDRVNEIEASYPDSSPVRDSKEGGLDESEELEDGVGEGGWKSECIGTPLTKTFQPGIW